MAPFTRTRIDVGWRFKQVGAVEVPEWDDGFLPVAQFPTNIHLDLMAHGKILDPFLGLNEYEVQWVDEQKWLYQTDFVVHSPPAAHEKLVLHFDGVDTFATVTLNGTTILETENMHRTYRADIGGVVRSGTNVLEILFNSAILRGKELLEETGYQPSIFTQPADKSRMVVRKAQYHYGWNWGPKLMTCGPWRPIYLERYVKRIADLWTEVDVSPLEGGARVRAAVELETGEPNDIVSFSITSLDGQEIASAQEMIGDQSRCESVFNLQNISLWWPTGYGEQPLYQLTASLNHAGTIVHSRTRKFGIRQASIVERPLKDAPGTTFFLQVNGVPIFLSGSNWCPADHFLPRVTTERYRTLLNMFVKGNQTCLRVWGGGVYEEDVFYEICDELGIVVWHDFMFACGAYPAHDAFLQTVTAEVEDNLRRLRHHPSIVAWAGCNEDYLFAELFRVDYNPSEQDHARWLQSNFPGRYIYEKLLPDICGKLISNTSYHPGSPWGGATANDPTVGDTHMWDVWHLKALPWQEYPKLGSRFISEFGMSSFPAIETIESYLVGSPAMERHPHSRTVDHHNKEGQHERKLATYLIENFKFSYDLEEYIYVSQLNQAEAMTCALRSWRRGWKGPGREYCGGSLIWQFSPTWQVTSKALIDYYNRPKLSYFTVKRDFAPISLGLEREEKKIPRFPQSCAFIDKKTMVRGWATNMTLKRHKVEFAVQTFELSTGREIDSRLEIIELESNMTTEVLDIELPVSRTSKEEPVIVATTLRLVHADGTRSEVIARCTNWPQPYRYLDMPTPSLTIRTREDKIFVQTNDVPVKGLAFYAEDVDSVDFEDNLIDLVPGDEQVVVAQGLNGKQVKFRYYGMHGSAVGMSSGPTQSYEGCILGKPVSEILYIGNGLSQNADQ